MVDVKCLNCDCLMVPHTLIFVCLKCEARVVLNLTDAETSWNKDGGF